MKLVLTMALSQLLVLAQQPDRFTNAAVDATHDLTTAEFFKDLGGNFRALPSMQNIVPVLATGAAFGFATIPEQDLERHFAPGNVWGSWQVPGKYIGNPMVMGGLSSALFAFSRQTENRRFRAFSYALLQGSIMSTAIVQPTKAVFGRLRPSGEDHHSFPSGHSTDTFMYATVIGEHYGWKAAVPAYAIASYVSMTRLADRKHHITDAAVGAGLGVLIGHTVSARMRTKIPSRISMNVYPVSGGFAGEVRIGLQ